MRKEVVCRVLIKRPQSAKKKSRNNSSLFLLLIISLCPLWSIFIFSIDAKGGEDFLLQDYWKRPIQFQLKTHNSQLTTHNFLYPDACGECHKEQYEGWNESLHSKAVGPGLLSQLDPHNNPETAMSCYYCHAPMEEQLEVIIPNTEIRSQKSEEENKTYIKNQSFDNRLKLSGVSCSVCHVREGKVYGPPGKKQLAGRDKKQNNHNVFIKKDFFKRAEFYAACHQLDEGYELNGKVLTNTYREWKDSFYGKNNITCQNCHMPDRQQGKGYKIFSKGGIHRA